MGAQVTIVYWPGKCSVTNKIIMFKLELWEAGSGITGRFEHLEEMDNPDAIVAIFSNLDRNSFDSLPDLLEQIRSEISEQEYELGFLQNFSNHFSCNQVKTPRFSHFY